MGKKKKIVLAIVAALVLLFAGGLVYAGNFFYELAFMRETNRAEVFEAEHNEAPRIDPAQEAINAWRDAHAYERRYITSFDGLNLHGYLYIHPESGGKWAIAAHGYGGNGWAMGGAAMRFYELGFNVLLPDARGCGQSGGDYMGMGWEDRLDVLSWVNLILREDAGARIVLYGMSMGATSVMMAAGENLPENVRAVIADSGYSSLWGVLSYQMDELYGLPSFPLLNVTSLVTKARAGFYIEDGDAVAQLAKSTTPMLFIHGEADTFVPSSMLDEVYEATSAEKQRLLVPDAQHISSFLVDEALYWQTVSGFLTQHMGEEIYLDAEGQEGI